MVKRGLRVQVICLLGIGLLCSCAAPNSLNEVSEEMTEEKTEETSEEQVELSQTSKGNLAEVYGKELPAYVTADGEVLELYSVGNGGYQVCIRNTTPEECRQYAILLEAFGFTKYSETQLPSGTAGNEMNLFYTYFSSDLQVFLSWNTALSTSRIVFLRPEPLPDLERPVLTENDTVIPSISQMQVENGMSYVIQLKDGSFIVIDGGVYGWSDSKRLYDFLMEKTPKEQPVIAAWMFTHPDPDHIELAREFISRYAGQVVIEAFAYNFPDCDVMDTKQDDQTIKLSIKVLEKNITDNYPDAITYTLHTGQVYYFKGVEIEILLTEEDVYPIQPSVYNDTSAAWRLSFDSGERFMVLGDCMHQVTEQLAATYGDYLKSDILQLAHHGLIGGDKELYQFIDPAVCFWATTEDRFNGTYTGEKYHWCLGEGGCDYNAWIRDETIRVREHYHNGVTTTLLMGTGKE